MAAIAVRKKVISIGHFSLCFRLQSMKILFICEFEEPFKEPEDYDEEEFHHQEGLSSQKAFQSKVQALTDTVMC